MSDAPQGPGWWVASDGKWYPPQDVPADAPPAVPPAPTGFPGAPPAAPVVGADGFAVQEKKGIPPKVLLGVVAAVVVLVLAFVVFGGDDGDGGNAIRPGQSRTAQISGAQVHRYTLAGVPVGTSVEVSVDGDDIDTRIRVVDGSGDEITANDDFDGLDPRVFFVNPGGAVIQVGLFGSSGNGSYTITVE